jgi:hypothetical protein
LVRREVGSAVSDLTRERLPVSAAPAAPARASSHFDVQLGRVIRRRGHIVAVDGMNLPVAVGEVFGVVGPNSSDEFSAIWVHLGRIPAAGTPRAFGAGAVDARIDHMTAGKSRHAR